MDTQIVEESQPLQSESQESTETKPTTEQPVVQEDAKSLDDIVKAEQEQIADLDKAGKESAEEEKPEGSAAEEGTEEAEPEETDEKPGKYEPNPTYKVLDDEFEFDPKLAKVLNEETEPVIRDLYEKAHGIETIKASRDRATAERDEFRTNYNNIIGEVGRVMNYRKSGDLQSFFEATQITDQELAKYILEKVRISQLPPEEQAVYNEREALRKRMNALEQNFQSVQATGANAEVQARISELDRVIGEKHNAIQKDFDARNGEGAFKTAVMNHGAIQYTITKKDLNPSEAVESFIKMNGITAVRSPARPNADPTRRIVARPKVKTIPNYGGGQASVTAIKKPRSIAELRELAKKMGS